eukprot:CAMPEP_0181034940 /NCGR_PEP_ID=MMETSP1070-20121207/8066_1 /TAXON_ID=265543 /ORGANISM="Minutocellus polymorphus, Strain NH13" /LENGTH=292 /DNA_ID=CAMNT_0023112483 /DNA_START=117 /DNA_END=995 /DNA_ORIENTATION=+
MADAAADAACRKESSGPGWQEHFVDAKRASNTASVGLAVSQSLSYVTISHFASMEERRALMDSAADVKGGSSSSSEEASSADAASDSNHILFASGANNNCDRYSVETLLNRGAKAASCAILNRLLGYLDGSGGDPVTDDPEFLSQGGGERMSDLAKEVFGVASSSGLKDMEVLWYDEPDEAGKLHPEPKVNVYSEGGYFTQHGDGMDLTILVVLADEFEGGGTAFYRDLDLSHDDIEEVANMSNVSHSLEPESVARPRAGTAMIWGGTLQHMALPVTKGTRAVFVGSFDLKK